MKAGLTISASAHAVLLLWGVVSFGPRPLNNVPPESLPVDIISATEFSQLVAGAKTAPKAPVPKPVAEKVAPPKPTEDPALKVVDKPEIVTAMAPPQEPPPVPTVPAAKPAPVAPQSRAEPRPPEAEKKPPEPKRDPIAEAVQKDEPKPQPKKEAKTPTPPKKPPPPPAPKFDANRIAALLDKRAPQRRAATAETINHVPTLGVPTGAAPTLSQSEIDALRAQIQACWNPPAGATSGNELIVQMRILLKQDGSLSAEPILLNRGSSPFFQIAAESAMRAVRRCQPYRLPTAKYEVWKDVEVTFDPRDLYRG